MDALPAPSKNRLKELDVLRAVAVLFVLGRHVLVLPDTVPAPVRSVFLFWRNVGWIGVDLFFVLSGFLISGLLFREFARTGSFRAGRFLARRGLKIYPAFYVFLVLSTCLLLEMRPSLVTRAKILSEMFFVQNYGTPMWNHTWSLAVEEHFYVGLALAFWLAEKTRGATAAFARCWFVIVGLCVIVWLARVVAVYRFNRPWSDIFLFTHFRIDSLLFGVLLSYAFHFHPERLRRVLAGRRTALVAASLLLLVPAFLGSPEQSRFLVTTGLTFLYIGFGVLMVVLLTWSSPQKDRLLARSAPLALMGRDSYSIYLWHMPCYSLAVTTARLLWRRDVFWVEILLYFAGAIGVGILLARLVEQPVLAFRDRWLPSLSGPLERNHPPEPLPR